MPDPARQVPEGSPQHAEFRRLYDVARRLRPARDERWTGELHATTGPSYFDQGTGRIELNNALLRNGFGGPSVSSSRWQTHALTTVLRHATEAGTDLEAPPGTVNTVRTTHSLALNNGVASVRAVADLQTFARLAGYPPPTFDPTQATGAHAAANSLVQQASGPRVDRSQLLDRLGQGPVAMQFDQLADAVVQNRLYDVVRADDQQGVRRELIGAMLHPAWERLAGQSPEAGQHVADEIGQALNAKVDEIRRRSPETAQVAPSDGPHRESTVKQRPQVESTARFLTGLAPAGGQEEATSRFLTGLAPAGGAAGRTSSLGDGSRSAAQHATSVTRSRAPGESVRR
ncbi:MAG TPA: hypothetical protein VG497_28785 [Kribbella sp.]|nr:hypothetical protein [Kribbella sp.]